MNIKRLISFLVFGVKGKVIRRGSAHLCVGGILQGSPTCCGDLTPEMKALIDRAGFVAKAKDFLFRHKVGAAIVAVRGAGATHAFDTVIHLFLASEMRLCRARSTRT